MGSGRSSSTSSRVDRLMQWLLIDANRLYLSGLVVVGVFVVTEALLVADVIVVGPRSTVKTLFGSGVTSGLFTLITIALTINQLISSRVFGSPNTLKSRYEGADALRESIEDVTGHSTSPVNTVAFISHVGEEMGGKVETFEDQVGGARHELAPTISEYVTDVSAYAAKVGRISPSMKPAEVTSTLAGSEYARLVSRTDHVRTEYADELSEEARETLADVGKLLEGVAVTRQYFKTITIQQEFANLSRIVIFTGLPALLVAIYVTLAYRSDPTSTVEPVLLPVLVSAAIAVVLAPLVVFLVYILRIATIMRYTVSVGPFAPPEEWPWEE